MTESDKNISLLLKSRLANKESFIEEDEWKLTEIELYKKRFYKFSLSYFNIYYASLLVCTSLFTLITGIRFLYISDNTSTTTVVKERKWQEIDSSRFQKSLNYSYEGNVSSKEVSKNSNSSIVVKKENINDNDKNKNSKKITPTSLNFTTQDSVKINNDLKEQEIPNSIIQKTPDNSVKKTATPKEETRIIYITKQDTIFKYDTLKVKKGKGKKK